MEASAASTRVAPSAVDVWRVDTTDGAAAPRTTLAVDELERAARLRSEQDRSRFVAAHVALREILSCYAGGPPALLRFAQAPAGKPFLCGVDRPRFNLSHTGNVALIAVADREVGVDVERVVTLDVRALAPLVLGCDERAVIGRCRPDERGRTFLRLWTLKEAFAKARGIGLGFDLASVDVSPALTPPTAGWLAIDDTYVRELSVGTAYVAAVAVLEAPARVVLRRWPSRAGNAPPRHRPPSGLS